MQTYGRLPVAFVRGEGVAALGQRGQASTSTSSAGSRSRRSATRTRRSPTRSPTRPARCSTCRTSTSTSVQPQVAARLDALLGGGGRVFFANSGAEANECAIKLARRYGQAQRRARALPRALRVRLVPRPHAHHARRHRPAAEAGDVPAAARPGFRQVAFGDLDALGGGDGRAGVRGDARADPGRGRRAAVRRPATSRRCARCATSARRCSSSTRCRPGLGRTGKWFGFQHADGVRPDIVTMAKALGNGVPIGACWARDDVAAAFQPGDHATTFGGQPLAARAALDGARGDGGRGRARAARRARGSASRRRCSTLPGVADVRGAGPADRGGARRRGIEAGPVAAACLDAGLVVNAVTPTALRFEPSLLVTDDEIDAAVAILDDGARGASAHDDRTFLEVDDLTPAAVRRGARRRAERGSASRRQVPQAARRARASRCCSRSRRPARARRPRWRSSASVVTRSTSGPRRSGSACASRSPTSPARSPGTAR